MKLLSSLIRSIALFIITLYQWCLSPLLPKTCRFYPSCSIYAKEQLKNKSVWKATKLILIRLFHCSPFSKKWPYGGVDLPSSTFGLDEESV